MKILMLGWEYPPHISGGLGTACEGLTRALTRLGGFEITFVVPYLYGGEDSPHMIIVDAFEAALARTKGFKGSDFGDVASLKILRVPSFLKPYMNDHSYQAALTQNYTDNLKDGQNLQERKRRPRIAGQYGENIFEEVARYAENVLSFCDSFEFDLIHAHDWMTYPAGIALAKRSGRPLIVHVHSLETDRSGSRVDQRIHRIERDGIKEASAVIAVSYYTRSIIHKTHHVPEAKISVVHNGVNSGGIKEYYYRGNRGDQKFVLFLGRVTYQKGPGFFVEAAAKVIPRMPQAHFIMAGSGDMLAGIIERVSQLGIKNNFTFTGFLKGKQVERAFALADLYVMPSVSEPFGISALEAINFDTPALISKQSGVAEVLHHSMKFDFWDVERLGDLIYNGLLYEELRLEMAEKARLELQKLRWDQAAMKTARLYRLVGDQNQRSVINVA